MPSQVQVQVIQAGHPHACILICQREPGNQSSLPPNFQAVKTVSWENVGRLDLAPNAHTHTRRDGLSGGLGWRWALRHHARQWRR